MPFQLHRPGTDAPSILTESDVRRILNRDLLDKKCRSRLEAPESGRTHLRQGATS